MDNTYFTIERAGILKKRFRARMFGGNNEMVWMTQTYADKRDAEIAIDAWVRLARHAGRELEVKDLTNG